MNRAQTRELSGNHPFVVQQKSSDEFTKQWNAPAQDLCSRVHSLTAALEQTIQYVYHLRIIISVLTDSDSAGRCTGYWRVPLLLSHDCIHR